MVIARFLRRGARLLSWPVAALIALSASAALACTTMVLGLPDRPLVAYSFDFDATGAGFMVVNPKEATRRSIMDDRPAHWPVRHASITFNQIGPGMPAAGMNTAGLVVSLMWNRQAVYAADEETPVVNELEFIQRLLDTAGSVEEALASLRDVQIQGMVPIHYLLADRFGTTAAITPTSAGLAIHKGMPVPALTNTSYTELLEKLVDFEGFGGNRPVPAGDRSADPGSLERFAIGASATRDAVSGLTTDGAFTVLGDVTNSQTRWQVVFDPSVQQIAFRMAGQPTVHQIDMGKIDFACTDHPLAIELSTLAERPAAVAPLDPARAAGVARTVLGSFSGGAAFPQDIADGLIEGLLQAVTCDN